MSQYENSILSRRIRTLSNRCRLHRWVVATVMMIVVTTIMATTVRASAGTSEISMGTTILAVKFDGGVIVAADTRTSVSGYVSNRYARKIVPFSPFGVLCRSGSAADTQHLADAVKWELSSRFRSTSMLGEGGVSQAAKLLRKLIVEQNNMDSAGLICCGLSSSTTTTSDGNDTKSSCQGEIYTVLPGGTLMEEKEYAVGGSGSTYILGWLDDALSSSSTSSSSTTDEQPPAPKLFSQRSKQEMINLCGRAVQLAMDRDGSSGGFVRLFVVDKDGVQEINDKLIVQSSSSTAKTLTSSNNSENSAKEKGVELPGFAPPQ